MMTEKLYYRNAYTFDFTANVISSSSENGKNVVILDRTCFYPEGGGQPADQGLLNEAEVLDVQLKDGEVLHYVSAPLSSGAAVSGKIDAERRFDYMQQHTGQHILSRSLLQSGGYQTVSVHFGTDYTAVEIDKAEIPKADLQAAEKVANEIIRQNLPVKIHWVKPEEVQQFDIRKPPPAVDKVRIVEVEGFDFSSCGGTHVSRSGEVGLIKITGLEKIRGRTRIRVKIGTRALRDYREKVGLVQQLTQLLTSGEEELPQRVSDLQHQLKQSQRELAKLQEEFVKLQAERLLAAAGKIKGITFVAETFESANNKMLKTFVEAVTARPESVAVAVGHEAERLQWVAGHSLSAEPDLKKLVLPLLPLIEGKGGGNTHLMQGGGTRPRGMEKFINQLKQKLEEELNNE